MEGMRHKLSLPGLGMSKCTDPSPVSGAAGLPCARGRVPSAERHDATDCRA